MNLAYYRKRLMVVICAALTIRRCVYRRQVKDSNQSLIACMYVQYLLSLSFMTIFVVGSKDLTRGGNA